MNPLNFRIGSGFDVHRFADNRDLIIGGVKIPFDRGLLGHSDADVLVHALMDALLGAANCGDIGILFPDSDDSYKNIDSCELLSRVAVRLRRDDFTIINCDMTVLCERPKIAPYREAMRGKLSSVLGIEPERLSIKATTTEGLGFTGRQEGIAAQAHCLLYKGPLQSD